MPKAQLVVTADMLEGRTQADVARECPSFGKHHTAATSGVAPTPLSIGCGETPYPQPCGPLKAVSQVSRA